jgi:hypothetical protein
MVNLVIGENMKNNKKIYRKSYNLGKKYYKGLVIHNGEKV